MPRPPYVFAYGSLLWSPEVKASRNVRARLIGYHRAPCLLSIEHRGTRQKPGVVFGLDEGGICEGVAQRLPEQHYDEDLSQIDERELITGAYIRMRLPIILDSGEETEAWAYVMRRDHPQYVADQGRENMMHLIRQGVGGRGPCEAYVRQTWESLRNLNIHDDKLEQLISWLDEPIAETGYVPIS